MSITPHDLLFQARQLLATASTEAEFRNTIGRAYYAAFHEAQRFHDALPSRGRKPSKKVGVHAKLAYRLQSPTVPSGDHRHQLSRMIGHHLQFLHARRVEADYRLDAHIDGVKARKLVERVERVFELCR